MRVVAKTSSRDWNPAASEYEAIIVLFQRHAAAWARDRGNRRFEQAWLDRFRRLLSPGAAILDIGCGSGEPIARYFLEQGYAVTGLDSAPAMIAIRASLFPTGRWRVADMRTRRAATEIRLR